VSITPEAFQALQALHDGARYNIMHTIARELIDAGLAHSGFGVLEITEAGRIWVRRGVTPRSYITDDPNVANLGPQNIPKKITSDDLEQLDRVARSREATNVSNPPIANMGLDTSRPVEKIDMVLPPEAPPEPEVMPPPPQTTTGELAWSRDRAVRAAGAASGQTDHWPPPGWLTVFMEAYEG